MEQIAVFTRPNVKSSITSRLEAKKAKGGIRCNLMSAPEEPKSSAVLNNGNWEEVSSGCASNAGSDFAIELDPTDEAVPQLLSALRTKKTIDEIVVYELNTTSNKEEYGYYFDRIFVKDGESLLDDDGKRLMILRCNCISFKQKDKNNREFVLWDWETNSHKYTGNTK